MRWSSGTQGERRCFCVTARRVIETVAKDDLWTAIDVSSVPEPEPPQPSKPDACRGGGTRHGLGS